MKVKGISSHILIESGTDETDQHFIKAIENIVIDIYGRRPDWLKFSPGKRFKRGDTAFREFVCMAGSVGLRLI